MSVIYKNAFNKESLIDKKEFEVKCIHGAANGKNDNLAEHDRQEYCLKKMPWSKLIGRKPRITWIGFVHRLIQGTIFSYTPLIGATDSIGLILIGVNLMKICKYKLTISNLSSSRSTLLLTWRWTDNVGRWFYFNLCMWFNLKYLISWLWIFIPYRIF